MPENMFEYSEIRLAWSHEVEEAREQSEVERADVVLRSDVRTFNILVEVLFTA
jgi:hypothetical protein